MARWTEDRERWMGGRGDPYGEEERRFRTEHEEGGMRGRGWRDEDRFGEWRRGERGGEWRGSERGREWSDRGVEPFGRGQDYNRDWREGSPGEGGGGYGSYGGRGDYSTFGSRDPFFTSRSEYPSAYGRDYPRGEYGRGERIPYGTTTFGPSGERYGDESRWGGDGGRYYGREHERGPFERLKEGMRKLTGKGPKGYHRSDERIQDEVAERIARCGIDADEVEVKVQNHEVTLSGYVESREDKRYLEDVADDVFGVDEVHNHLRIRREHRTGTDLGTTAGTGTTGTGAAMSGQQRTTQQQRTGPQPGQPGRH